MFNLMKLEWKKHRLERYFTSYFVCVISIFAFVVLLSLDTKNSIEGPMSSFYEFMSLVTILSNITFIIFGINRKQLLFAKLILSFLFTRGCLFIGVWLIQIFTYFLQPSLGLFEGTVTIQDLLGTLPKTIMNSIMMGLLH